MSIAGNWKLTLKTPFGVQTPVMQIQEENNAWSGHLDGASGKSELEDLTVDGNRFGCSTQASTPMGVFQVSFQGTVDGDSLNGTLKTMMGDRPFTGERQ